MSAALPPISLPETLPSTLPEQQFALGSWVYWYQVPNPDFGRIVGVVYTQAASCTITGLHYLVKLDQASPSYAITAYDFAFSEDLRLLDESSLHILREEVNS